MKAARSYAARVEADALNTAWSTKTAMVDIDRRCGLWRSPVTTTLVRSTFPTPLDARPPGSSLQACAARRSTMIAVAVEVGLMVGRNWGAMQPFRLP